MPTRTSEAQPGDDETASRPVIVELHSDSGLDAFAPEAESSAVSIWPSAERASGGANEPGVEEAGDPDVLARWEPHGDSAAASRGPYDTFPASWGGRSGAGHGAPALSTSIRAPRAESRGASDEPDAEPLIPPPVHEHQPPPQPASIAPEGGPDRTRQLLVGLAVLVLLQAIPTILWLQARVSPSVAPAAAAAALPTDTSADLQVATTGLPVRTDVVLPAPPPAAAPVRSAARGGARPAPQPAPKSPPAPAVIAAGLLSVDAPVPMQVVGREGVVGTSEAATIMLPPGTHDLEFRNEAVGYQERQTVTLRPGQTTRVRLAPPSGRLHVNALPWAEVWIDNARAGETPIGNLEVPVGTHEVVFRHPELGERRAKVLVTLKEPARVSVDLRRP